MAKQNNVLKSSWPVQTYRKNFVQMYVHVHHVTLVRILHLILVKVSFYSYNSRNMGRYDIRSAEDAHSFMEPDPTCTSNFCSGPCLLCFYFVFFFFELVMYINMIKSSFLQSYKGRNCIHLYVYTSELFRDQRKPPLYK